jgi:predicted nucleotidyltransferase
MPLSKDWRAVIESLNSHGVEYVVVGAVAVAYYGRPRYTGDLDVLVRNSPENAERREKVLAGLGFAALELKSPDFVNSYHVIQLGVAPNRIDLLTSLTGVTFDEAWAGRVESLVGETRINIIGREALILNKRLTGRAQDEADLEALGADQKRNGRASRPGRVRQRRRRR